VGIKDADSTPATSDRIGGGLPIIQDWAKHTLTPQCGRLWQTLFHKSGCLACAWGTGGQKGGFVNEDGEILQRCARRRQKQHRLTYSTNLINNPHRLTLPSPLIHPSRRLQTN
jgi:hypothetical protein